MVGLALFTLTGFAAPKFTVSVFVSGDSTNEISSFLTRELRDLPDVTVADRGEAIYQISVASIQITVDGKPNACALSILTTSRMDPDAWGLIVSTNELSIVQSVAKDLCTLEAQEVKVLPTANLKSTCQSIVADFDRSILERQRKIAAGMLKASETNAPSKRLESHEPEPSNNDRANFRL